MRASAFASRLWQRAEGRGQAGGREGAGGRGQRAAQREGVKGEIARRRLDVTSHPSPRAAQLPVEPKSKIHSSSDSDCTLNPPRPPK